MAAGLTGNRTLEQCIEEIPHRQYLAMHAWLTDQWNKPNRTDWYLMQVAQVVRNKESKSPIGLGMFKIPFEFTAPPDPKEVEKTLLEKAKAKWFGFTGLSRKKK